MDCATSHPTMGAWIEIIDNHVFDFNSDSRTPRWVRGLKFLKYMNLFLVVWSHPTMGAWIEIQVSIDSLEWIRVAPHDGCVD